MWILVGGLVITAVVEVSSPSSSAGVSPLLTVGQGIPAAKMLLVATLAAAMLTVVQGTPAAEMLLPPDLQQQWQCLQRSYSLSIRDVDQQGVNVIKHYKIRSLDNGGYYISPKITFPDIPQMLKHYHKQSDGLCRCLDKPCSKPKAQMPWDKDAWEISKESIKMLKKLGAGQFGEVWLDLQQCYAMRKGNKSDYLVALKKHLGESWRQYDQLPDSDEHTLLVVDAIAFLQHYQHLNSITFNDLQSEYRKEILHLKPKLCDCINFFGNRYDVSPAESLKSEERERRKNTQGKSKEYEPCDSLAIPEWKTLIKNPQNKSNLLCYIGDGAKFPIKWTAPEAINYGSFTIKSDMWSFGILLYEIVTYGKNPYPGMSNADVMNSVQRGYRMPSPDKCPQELYDIMTSCWKSKPEDRPTFDYLQSVLDDFYTATEGQYQQQP
ncbi:UNVERIFIED_CONTAM: hypothetical protein FKN15_039680 [Acipenser sinensis]